MGPFVHIAGETPLGEPIVVTGSDRLVLRRGTRSFWVAGTCQKCGLEAAGIDLGPHQRVCRGPSRQRAPLASPRPARPEPQPQRAPLASPRPARPEPQPVAQPGRRLPSRPISRRSPGVPRHRRQLRFRRSSMSVNSRRLTLIYADAISVLIIVFVIFVAVVVIIIWADSSSPQWFH